MTKKDTFYNIYFSGIDIPFTKEEYKEIYKEKESQFSEFYKKMKKKTNGDFIIKYILKPKKGINILFLLWLYKSNIEFEILIPELSEKNIDKQNLIKILKEKYDYNKEQITLFLKIIKEDFNKIITNFKNEINLHLSIWLGENDYVKKDIKQTLKIGKPVFDLDYGNLITEKELDLD